MRWGMGGFGKHFSPLVWLLPVTLLSLPFPTIQRFIHQTRDLQNEFIFTTCHFTGLGAGDCDQ